MALRLLEVTLPEGKLEEISDLLEDSDVVHQSSKVEDGSPDQLRVLLDAEDTEALSDALMERFESQDDFRLIMVAVEATLPVREESSEDASEGEGDSGGDRGRRISREELYSDLSEACRLTPVYVVMVMLSTVVAAVGLLRGDVAIIVGAMVIAPLLGPTVALSLAATLGDLQLGRRSLLALATGFGAAGLLALLMGGILEVDPTSEALAARTRPALADTVLALAAGAAGSLAFTSGVSGVVVGVMVAVALLPPLVVAGLLAGAGYGVPATGALILTLTNVTCINLAAVATFLLQRIQPRTWWESERARKATRIAVGAWIVLLAVLVVLMIQFGPSFLIEQE